MPGEEVGSFDLGTTKSAVAALEAGSPTIIPNSEGARTTLASAEISPQVLRMLCEDAAPFSKADHTEPFSMARVLAELEEFRKDMQAKLDVPELAPPAGAEPGAAGGGCTVQRQ